MSQKHKRNLLVTSLTLLLFSPAIAFSQTPDASSRPREVGRNSTASTVADDAALTELQRAVEAAADQPAKLRMARYAYAQALAKARRDDEAATQYEALVRDSSEREPVAYYNLGNVYLRLTQNEKAAAAFQKAIEQRFGRYPRASNNLGLALIRLGRLADAREAFIKAIAGEQGNFADAHYNLARVYQQQGDPKRAGAHLAAALRLEPDFEDARLLAAEMNLDLKANNKAVEEAVASSSRTDSRTDSRMNSRTEKNTKAVTGNATAQTIAVKPEAFSLLQQARSAFDKGKLTRALSLYQASLKAEGSSVALIEWEMATVLARLDNPAAAEEAFRRVIAQAGDRYPMAYYNAGREMIKQQKYGAAVVMLRQALTRVGETPYIYLALSESLEKTDNFDGAILALEKYIEVLPKGDASEASRDEEGWVRNRIVALNEKKEKAGKP